MTLRGKKIATLIPISIGVGLTLISNFIAITKNVANENINNINDDGYDHFHTATKALTVASSFFQWVSLILIIAAIVFISISLVTKKEKTDRTMRILTFSFLVSAFIFGAMGIIFYFLYTNSWSFSDDGYITEYQLPWIIYVLLFMLVATPISLGIIFSFLVMLDKTTASSYSMLIKPETISDEPTYNQPVNDSNSRKTLYTIGFVFTVIGTLAFGFFLLPLLWSIPMCITAWNAVNQTGTHREVRHTSLGICTLIFVNFIGGIFILVASSQFNPYQLNYINT